MIHDWQSFAAPAVVALTLATFLRALFLNRRKRKSCGRDCCCGR